MPLPKFFLLALTLFGGPVWAADNTVFHFCLKDSAKEMNLVRSAGTPGSYQYRFGKKNQPELEFPKVVTPASQVFELDSQSPRGFELAFHTGGFRYSIYEAFNEKKQPIEVGIIVKNMKTRAETRLIGDVQTISGNLSVLQDDPLVPKVAVPPSVEIVTVHACSVYLDEVEKGEYRLVQSDFSVDSVRKGLPEDLMKKINDQIKKKFGGDLAAYKAPSKKGGGLNFLKACDKVEAKDIQPLIGGRKRDDRADSDESMHIAIATLGSKIVTVLRYYYGDTGIRIDSGAENLAFYRIADGKEVSRKNLFTKEGLKVVDKEIQKELCSSPDSQESFSPCERFTSVFEHGHFFSEGHQVVVGFSRQEISPGGDERGTIDSREFDSFVR